MVNSWMQFGFFSRFNLENFFDDKLSGEGF